MAGLAEQITMDTVYFNKAFVAHDKATVSIKDRGFLYSDSIYETLPIENARCLSLNDRLDRLNDNLKPFRCYLAGVVDKVQYCTLESS